MTRMFPFITETWNPFTGPCPFECSYCWARSLINRHKWPKYVDAESGIDEKQIKRKFKPGAFVFVQDMSDASIASLGDVARVMTVVKLNPEVFFLFLVKNPSCYLNWIRHTATRPPENAILGATVETDNGSILSCFSKAPHPVRRIDALLELSLRDIKTFVSMEPIMDFDEEWMFEMLAVIDPWGIAIGYDNYHNDLPEPPLSKTLAFIADLEAEGIKVYKKTLRESSNSKGERI